MTNLTAPLAPWFKRLMAITGLLLFLPGLPATFSFFCLTPLLLLGRSHEAIWVGLASFTLMITTVGAGGITLWHSLRSLQGKVSQPLFLPPAWTIAGVLGLWIAIGLFVSTNNFAVSLLFPPILFIAAALPPLLAISWFTNQHTDGLTWRRGLVALAGGATVGVVMAIILEILFPTLILALVLGLANRVIDSLQETFSALAGKNIASAMTQPSFIYLFIQIALIAPLAEELAKPLVTLPVIGYLSRRDAFLVGAMAGAGFATLENVLYAGFGFYFWSGILIVRALGGAIHPLASGLVALGWRDSLRGEPNAGWNWVARFGLAVGLHALWNGGSLLVITLAGAQFFGELPPQIDILGLSTAGVTLALLIVLGLAALWMGRSIIHRLDLPTQSGNRAGEAEFILSNRTIAIWALACLVAIVPAGIIGLQLLMG